MDGDRFAPWTPQRPSGAITVKVGVEHSGQASASTVFLIFLLLCVKGHCLNMGSRLFGRCWHAGDVVGCMINMEDKSIIFTLNGEILITTKGSELCFTDFDTEDGEAVPCHQISAVRPKKYCFFRTRGHSGL